MFRKHTLAAGALVGSTLIATARWNDEKKDKKYFNPFQQNLSYCSGTWPFDTRGMKTIIKPPTLQMRQGSIKSETPLYLAGVGMRKKNFYVVDVDVYLIGINASEKTLTKTQEWLKDSGRKGSLSDYLMEAHSEDLDLSATLKFARGITRAQFVEAFTEAFKGCDEMTVKTFQDKLGDIIGESIKKDDEIAFYWTSLNDIAISKNGSEAIPCRIHSAEVAKRLLEIYVDPAKTVSKELAICMKDHLIKLTF